jgi:HAE1 family hydrophobic/amphiphilic exporter-1
LVIMKQQAGRSVEGRGSAVTAFVIEAIVLAAIAAGAAWAGEGGPAKTRALSLDDAILMAFERNDAIVIERESVAAARAAQGGARGAYDPLLELSAGWERATLPVNSAFSGAPSGEVAPTDASTGGSAAVSQLLPTGATVALSTALERRTTDGAFTLLSPSYLTRAGVEFRQPLLRNRATDGARSAIRIASSDIERAEASLRHEVTETVSAVEVAYWNLVFTRREVSVLDESVRLAAEQLEETEARLSEGAASEAEPAQPRAELERRRGESYAAREAASRAENVLKLLILGDGDGSEWSVELVPADEPGIAVEEVDVEGAMERALASRPEIAEAEALRARSRAQSDLSRDAVRPSLDLVASYDRYGFSGRRNPEGIALDSSSPPPPIPSGLEGSWHTSLGQLDDGEYDDARIGLQFSLPLGNRSAKSEAAIALAGVRQSDAGLSQVRKRVRAEILYAAASLETTGQRIRASRAAREAAEIQLSSEQERYRAGLSTNFLVLTRQNDLSRARLDEIAALTDYRKARTEMARAAGSLLEERSIDIDTSTHAGEGNDPS